MVRVLESTEPAWFVALDRLDELLDGLFGTILESNRNGGYDDCSHLPRAARVGQWVAVCGRLVAEWAGDGGFGGGASLTPKSRP